MNFASTLGIPILSGQVQRGIVWNYVAELLKCAKRGSVVYCVGCPAEITLREWTWWPPFLQLGAYLLISFAFLLHVLHLSVLDIKEALRVVSRGNVVEDVDMCYASL